MPALCSGRIHDNACTMKRSFKRQCLHYFRRHCENILKKNSNKTQCILFATPNFKKRTETFQITIDDTVRQMEDKVKNQEAIFGSRLSFEHHFKSLCSRLNGTLSYLNRVKNTLDQKSKILIINVLIFSDLNYCI